LETLKPDVLPVLLVINPRTNLGAELFLQPADYRILLGTAPASGSRPRPAGCGGAITFSFSRRHRRAGNNLQLDGPPQNAAGRSDRQPPGVGAQRHIDNG